MKQKMKLSKVFYKAMKIITVIALCGMAIALVGGIVTLCLPSRLFENFAYRIKLSNLQISFDTMVILPKYAKAQMVFNILRGFVLVGIAFVICFFLTKVVKNFVSDAPFEQKNSRYITIVGICIAFLAVAPNGLDFLIDTFVLQIAGGESVLLGLDAVKSIKVDENIVNVAVLFLGALTIFLAEVFRRGKFLQDEYDTTI